MSNLKNLISNIAALAIIIGGAVHEYLQVVAGGEIDFWRLLGVIGVALIGYLTGKSPQLKK
jgi:hypothetical protein